MKVTKSIEVTLKSTTPSGVETDAKDSEDLLNFLVEVGKMISTKTEEANFKMKVESLSFPDVFFNNLNARLMEEHIEDVKVVFNSKWVK